MVESNPKLFKRIAYWAQIQRGLAFIIDFVIVLYPLSLFLGIRFFNIPYFYSIVATLLLTVYFTYFEYKWGQTIGKKILGVKVYMDSGKSCTLKAALIRNILGLFERTIGFWLTFVLLYVTPKKQRIGDMVAHTVVVRVYE